MKLVRQEDVLAVADDFIFTDEKQKKQYLVEVFKRYKPDLVVHLAAKAGVRYSVEYPELYILNSYQSYISYH